MGRPTDFGDKTIKKGFGPDKDKKLSVKDGQKLVVRVVTKLEEYLSHAVHDILPPKRDEKTGANVPSIFNMSCARKWDPSAGTGGDYVGECRGHDKDYDVNERYVGGVMVLGIVQGKTLIPFAPSDCGKFWDMTAGRVAELREAITTKFPDVDAADVGEKLRRTDLLLGLKAEGGAEMYQKLTINVWEGSKIPITEEHKNAYKAEIPAILKEVSAPATLEEQDRRLKRKVGAPAAGAATGQAAEQAEDNLDDLDLDGGAAPAAPAPAPKRATRAPAAAPAKAAPKAAPAPVATAEDDLDLSDATAEAPAEEEPAPAPAPPPKKAAPSAAKKTATATAAVASKATEAVVNDMLDGLEGLE